MGNGQYSKVLQTRSIYQVRMSIDKSPRRFWGWARKGVSLSQRTIVKAPGLLPMLYTLHELSEELNIAESTLRDWLNLGMPHQRDAAGHIWISGVDASNWIRDQRKPRTFGPLSDGEAYCFHCKAVVNLVDPVTLPIKGKLVHYRGACERCGSTINRGGRLG